MTHVLPSFKRLGVPLLVAMAMLALAGHSAWAQQSAPAPGKASGKAWMEKDRLCIAAGDYVVRFWEKAAWTLCAADYKSKPILITAGAFQSVLKIRGKDGGKSQWIGSGHGGEDIQSITVEVDGSSRPLESGFSATGSVFTVVKVSQLGPYKHTARVRVAPDGITEDLHYEMAGQPVDLEVMYAFMHCFTNDTRQWIAGLGGEQEERGEFADDNKFTLKKDIRWAMVYAPSSGVGMVYAYPEIYRGNAPLRNAFWNRPRDNKIYLSVMPSQEPGAKFDYSVRLRAFEAPEAQWEAAGRKVLADVLAAK